MSTGTYFFVCLPHRPKVVWHQRWHANGSNSFTHIFRGSTAGRRAVIVFRLNHCFVFIMLAILWNPPYHEGLRVRDKKNENNEQRTNRKGLKTLPPLQKLRTDSRLKKPVTLSDTIWPIDHLIHFFQSHIPAFIFAALVTSIAITSNLKILQLLLQCNILTEYSEYVSRIRY